MMRLHYYAAAASLLALTACGGPGKDEAKVDKKPQAAGPQAAASAGVAGQINPGEWEMTVETSIEGLPNMPAASADMMKAKKVTNRSCVTPEEAKQPPKDMFSAGHKDCTISDQQIGGGTMHAAMTCNSPGGGKAVITADGRYGGDSLDVRSRVETSGRGPAMTITSHVSGKRLGDCPATKG